MRRFTALFYIGPWILAGAGAWTTSCATGVTPESWGEGGANVGGGSIGGGGDGAGGGGTGLSGPCTGDETTDCYTGPAGTENIGVCESGTAQCVQGSWGECEGETHPGIEICNGEDDDCNAIADDGNPNGGDPCNTGEPGPCAEGTLMCEEGMVQCVDDVTPTQEQCNDIDDDCNGEVDDGNPEGGAYCSTGLAGICAAGTMTCQGGGVECLQNLQPATEVCDSQDNDCNGSTDEGNLCQSGYSCTNGSCQWICPYVYGHDGGGYRYETSVGGAGIKFGSPGEPQRRLRRRERRVAQSFQPMWARLDHARPSWRPAAASSETVSGSVRAKLLAAEDEIVYLRSARLAVVDHPAGCEVLSETSADWRILKQPQRKGVLALHSHALRPPRRATWRGSEDVTVELGEQTDQAVRFDRRKPNYYELDFGEVRDSSQAKLVIDGWKFREVRDLPPFYRVTQPRIEVEQADGRWLEVMRVPTPRGDRKAVVVDLAAVAWPTGHYRMRLWTGTHQGGQAMWYLDRVRLTEQPPAPVEVRQLEVNAAVLGHSGPPTMHCLGDPSRPRLNTDDGGGLPVPDHETIGQLTRHGEVQELLGADDDRLVVMQRGDGVELEFDGLPAPGPGSQQTLFLDTELTYRSRVRVGAKQSDAHRPARVEPLPYAEPADGGAPDAIAHERYLKAYQTRPGGQESEQELRKTG